MDSPWPTGLGGFVGWFAVSKCSGTATLRKRMKGRHRWCAMYAVIITDTEMLACHTAKRVRKCCREGRGGGRQFNSHMCTPGANGGVVHMCTTDG